MRAKMVVLSLIIGALACATAWAGTPKKSTAGNLEQQAGPSVKVTSPKAQSVKLALGDQAIRLPGVNHLDRKEASNTRARTEGALNFAVDSGTNAGGWGYGPGFTPFIALNRYTVNASDFPFALTDVSAYQAAGAVVGEAIRVVVLFDADGDGNPANATILSVQPFTVGLSDGWEDYDITPVLVSGPAGDIYLGIAYDAVMSNHFPMGVDDETSAGGGTNSYEIAWGNCDQVTAPNAIPNPLTWPPDCLANLSSTFAYNGAFMIRGAGFSPAPPIFSVGATSFTDACPYDGGANDDGYADPGETITYYAQINNIGFVDATNVVATLTSPYPFSIISGSAALGTIAVGGNATAVFTFDVPLSAQCGDLADLDIAVSAAEEPGLWGLGAQLRIGEFYLGPTDTLLSQNFETWPLAGWTINADPSGMTWYQGSLGYWANFEGTGDFAGIDSWQYLPFSGTSELVSPSFDIAGGYETANLYYKTAYYDYYGASSSYLDISTDGGTSWSHLQTFWDELFGGVLGPQNVDLSSYIGMSGLQLRFLANSPMYYTIWQVDDLAVTGKYADVCFSTTCLPPFAIHIITPYDQQDLYGMTQICATVTDDSIVDFVTWSVNGVPLAGCENLTTLPYCCIFDPQMYARGVAHTLTATATLVDGSTYSSTIHFYVVGAVTADPDAWPPSGLAPLPVRFLANAKSGSGKYLYSWWKSSVTNAAAGEWMMDSHGDKVFTSPSLDYTFGTVGDYLVTLFVTDTMGTDDPTDDVVFMALPVKITVTQLATPDTDTDNIKKAPAASL